LFLVYRDEHCRGERKKFPERKEFIQFLYIARGSLFEAITVLIIFSRNKWINDAELEEMKVLGDEIGKMLSSLINAVKSVG